jgi:hypothetical protein
MYSECSSDEIDGPTLNCFKGIGKRVVHSVWRLEMSEGEMVDDIILIFEATLKLMIARESFN